MSDVHSTRTDHGADGRSTRSCKQQLQLMLHSVNDFTVSRQSVIYHGSTSEIVFCFAFLLNSAVTAGHRKGLSLQKLV